MYYFLWNGNILKWVDVDVRSEWNLGHYRTRLVIRCYGQLNIAHSANVISFNMSTAFKQYSVFILELHGWHCLFSVKVRLAGVNRPPNAGSLEINYNGTWGTVCDYYFNDTDAQVACFMLGFGWLLSAFIHLHLVMSFTSCRTKNFPTELFKSALPWYQWYSAIPIALNEVYCFFFSDHVPST